MRRSAEITLRCAPERRESSIVTITRYGFCVALACATVLSGAVWSLSGSSAAAQDAAVPVKKPHPVAVRRGAHPAAPPESQQGQVTQANKNAPNAGAVPFVPPLMTMLPGGGMASVDTKGISLNDADQATKFRIGGRLQYDFDAASLNPRKYGPALSDNDSIRRAYFESYLSLSIGIEVAFQYDFNDPVRPIVDAIVSYHGIKPYIVTVGNFKEPFSLNQLMSDNTTTFTERSLLDAFAPGRSFGGAIGTSGDRWTAVGGVFGANANFGPDTNGVAGTGRVTYAPILSDTQLLHFGVAGSYRSLDPNGLTASFSSRPEDYLFTRALVNTGTLKNAADVGRVGAEVIYQFGSYRIQGEYAYTDVGGRNGQADRSFQAGYVEGAWVINGKGRPYRIAPPYGSEFGVLQGVQVEDSQRISQGGIGVWEVAARYSAIDLRTTGLRGGAEQDVSAGINWYPDRNIRMMADYVHASANPAAFTIAKGNKIESDIFTGRVQFNW